MSWLLDRPVYVVILGVLLCLPIFIAWVMTGRKEVLYALLAACVVLAALLMVERVVVTDREAIEATLPRITRDVEANDHQAVLNHINSGAPELKGKVQKELPNYVFTECRITSQPNIEIDAKANPRKAKVTFLAAAAGEFKYGGDSYPATKEQPIRRRIILFMKKEADGRWTVEDYDHEGFENEFIKKKTP